MRTLTRFTSTGAVGALGLGTLVASGVLAATGAGTGDPGPAPAAASALVPFRSCAELRSWYVDAALGEVGPFGWDNGSEGRVYATGVAAPEARAAAPISGTADAVGSSATGTNTQEAGVDEPDVAKTDGHLLVRVQDRSVLVSDVSGDQPRALASYRLPGPMYGAELLLVGDRVVVSDSSATVPTGGPVPRGGVGRELLPPAVTGTRILTLDLADPAHPRAVSDQTYSGSLLSVRQYGRTVRLVTSTQRPELPFTRAYEGDPTDPPVTPLGDRAASARNRAVVEASTLGAWLPTVRDSSAPASAARPVVGCSDVLHPVRPAGPGTLTVVGFDVAHPEDRSTVALTAAGDTVYSSTDALYVATTRSRPALFQRFGDRPSGRLSVPAQTTQLHRFDLSGTGASYVASGSVRGTVRDRWSLDAYDGRLRVALQTGNPVAFDDGAGRHGSNAIVTLARHGDSLVETGRVGGLGDGEEIKSVRWFDDLAVLVTFRQMDPLYTVDLADPAHPVLAGELTIPGFSGYLHPIGHDRLLGLGTDAGADGRARGALVSVFDLTDRGHPTLVARRTLGADTQLSAPDDPRSFTWLPAAAVGYTAVQTWSQAADGQTLTLARISAGDGLAVSTVPVPGVAPWQQTRVLPLPDGRMVLVAGDAARTMTP